MVTPAGQFARPVMVCGFFMLFVLLLFLVLLLYFETGFYVYPWLSWNSLCRPGWPQIQQSTCLCLPSAGIKGLCYHCLASGVTIDMHIYSHYHAENCVIQLFVDISKIPTQSNLRMRGFISTHSVKVFSQLQQGSLDNSDEKAWQRIYVELMVDQERKKGMVALFFLLSYFGFVQVHSPWDVVTHIWDRKSNQLS